MKKKMLVLDIDGTLTNSKKEISKKTLDKLMQVQEDGHIVVIASGRPTPGTMFVANELKISDYNGYILSYNGALITNLGTGEIVYNQPLNPEVIKPIYEYAGSHDLGMITYDKDSVLVGYELDEYIELEARINQLPTKKVKNLPEYVDFPVQKCLLTGEPEHAGVCVEELQKLYEGKLSIYRSEAFFIEIMALGIDKAASLNRLIEILGMDVSDVISFGDGYNDKSMIEWAGTGVAMGNAVDEVKAVADYVTLTNDEDGLIPAIDKFVYGCE